MASTLSSSKNNINLNYPVVLNKITLRYQDTGPAKPIENNMIFDSDLEDLDDEKYHQQAINNDHNFNEAILFDENKISFNRKGNKKGINREKAKEFSLEKSLNRLSLLKFREHLEDSYANNNYSSQNERFSKRNSKVNSLVAEIVPLITSTNREQIAQSPSTYNQYYDQNAPMQAVPLQTGLPQANVTPILPKVSTINRSQTFNTFRNSSSRDESQIPTSSPIIQTLPRPYTNHITQKNKVFNLVYGINNKFMQKYLPNNNEVKKDGLMYLNKKLPGHLALYKIMKESKSTLNPINTTDLERIRREILSRNSLNQSQLVNEINTEYPTASSPRLENMSPNNFTFNKNTLKRNYTIHETPNSRRSTTSNYASNQSNVPETPIMGNNSNNNSQLKHSESVMAYLSHLSVKEK